MSAAINGLLLAASELLALAKRYASECAECDGSAERVNNDDSTSPCPECADIRAVIAKAEGRE